MKRVLLASLLAACAFAASAQQASVSAQADASVRTDGATQAQVQADTKSKTDIDRNCLRQTGTHIRDRSATDGKGRKRCVAANGRVYTRDDIDRTGQTDIAEALRQLDPSIH